MTKRAAIYARYSSDRQKDTSLDDQVSMAHRFAEGQGWEVVGIFTDRQKTGRNKRRPGFQALTDCVEAGQVDVVIVEAVDRLTRRIADALNHFDLFRFQKTDLHSVTEGPQDFFKVLLAGLGAQFYAESVAAHSKRAMKGGIERGRLHTSAYGYRNLAVETGLNREVDPAEAAVVLRIFEEFADGRSAMAIAHGLNVDGIDAPKGGSWDPSSIRGHEARGEGILNNSLYIGVVRVCATSRSYHPESGAQRVVLTPDETVEASIPELRIVPQALWDQVKAAQALRRQKTAAKGNPVAARRTRHLFSGLVVCGCCGGRFVKHSKTSFKCGEARKGACVNQLSMSQKRIEKRVFDCIRSAFLSPELVKQFDKAVAAERKKLDSRDFDGELTGLRAELATAQGRMDGILHSIEEGAQFATFKARAAELDAEIARITAAIGKTEATRRSSQIASVDIKAVYASAIAEMEVLLGDPALVDQAHELLSTLIRRIVLTPDDAAAHGLAVTLEAGVADLLRPTLGAGQPDGGTNDLLSISC